MPGDETAVAESFRLLHNLKAAAAATGYQAIADLAHALETVFGRIRARELPFGGDVGQVLFEGVDLLSALVQNVLNANSPAPDIAPLLARLDTLQPGEAPAVPLGSAEPLPEMTGPGRAAS